VKLKTRSAALFIAAVAAVAGVPTAAAADDSGSRTPTASESIGTLLAYDEQMFTDDDNSGGRVRFTQRGDKVELCDIQKDGYSTFLQVYNNETDKLKYTLRVGGFENCETVGAVLGSTYNLAEGDVHLFQISLVKGDSGINFWDLAFWVA